MLATKKIIPEFFGFEGVGILFRDSVKNTLFSVEDQEVEEDRKILNIKESRKKNNQELTHAEKMDDV